MKLTAIEDMVALRSEFYTRQLQLQNLKKFQPQTIRVGNSNIEDHDVMNAARVAMMGIIQKRYDEAKTKLMMVGITEFPE